MIVSKNMQDHKHRHGHYKHYIAIKKKDHWLLSHKVGLAYINAGYVMLLQKNKGQNDKMEYHVKKLAKHLGCFR